MTAILALCIFIFFMLSHHFRWQTKYTFLQLAFAFIQSKTNFDKWTNISSKHMCEFLKFQKLWAMFSQSSSAIHFEFRSLFVISLKKKTFDFLLSDVNSDTFPDRSCGVSAWCVSRCDKSHTCAVKSDIVLGLSSSQLPLFGLFGVKRWQVCEYLTDPDCVLTRCSLRWRAHFADYYSQRARYFSIC